MTTWDIVSETLTLLRYRSSYRDALEFLDEIVPTLEIITYDDSVRDEAKDIFKKFGKERPLSFCDCISFVVATTILKDIPCFGSDRDFRSMGLNILTVPQSS